MISVTQDGNVFVLRMDNGENRFNSESVRALHSALDDIESVDGPLGLVTTGAGKFYSNGLDLDWLMSAGDAAAGFIDEVHRLLVRILEFPAITVAAVNGHAFAGGAMLACAHDVLVMREDRGYWCLPEVDLGLPLTETMYRVVSHTMPTATLKEALLTGRRYDAAAMVARGIATESAPESEVVSRAIAIAAEVAGKDRAVVIEHKRLMRG